MLISPAAEAGQLPSGPAPFPSPAPATGKSKGHDEPLGLFPVEAQWTLALNSALTAAPGFDGGRGYFPIEGGRIVAYDLADGQQLWVAPVGTAIEPAAGGGFVFVVGPDSLLALRATDGSIAWQLPFVEPLAVPLVWERGWLVAATRAGVVLAIRAEDGEVLWRQALGSPAGARPALSADRVYVPISDGRVAALALDGGKIIWEHKLGGGATDLLPLDDRLFVGSKDHFFYSLKTQDGSSDWRWRTGADIIGVPIVDRESVYFVSLDNVLRALHRNNGVQRWKRGLPFRPTSGPLKAADTLVISGLSTTLRGFATKDGAPAGELPIGAELAAPPHVLPVDRRGVPSIVVCTQDLAKGATVASYARSIEPQIIPMAPLPNATAVPATLPPPLEPSKS